MGLRVPAPVLLADNLSVPGHGSPATDLAMRLARQIASWYLTGRPSQHGAILDLAVTLFGSVGGDQLPLVQLRSIPIDVSRCSDTWWEESER
jgi:hypothetical protein